jgi:signal transduction histidine kinase
MIVVVLVASMIVTGVLATQAIVAARQRRAISQAMLRQYAQLAAAEFARQARRDVEQALGQSLAGYAHPEHARHGADASCGCLTVDAVEQWFEVTAGGDVVSRTGALSGAWREHITTVPLREATGGMDGTVRVASLRTDPTRVMAVKPEPHLSSGNTQVGLVTTTRALSPILASSYDRASLLPAVLAGDRGVRSLVDLHVRDSSGAVLFRSRETDAGPYAVQIPIWSDESLPLVAEASMTPGFIATLGPEHGAGPSIFLTTSLLALNVLFVIIGLRQLRRERELARLRSEFVAGVSHELRTPLAQIRLFVDTLLLGRVRDASEQRRALEIIGQESTRLSHLVDNVLLFHRRREPLKTKAAWDAVDLEAFAAGVVDSFQPIAASKRVQLIVSRTAGDVTIRADADSLRQVLLNLLDNAVKYGPPGQTITVSVTKTADSAVLAVDDAGPGVNREDRNRVFAPFVRGSNPNGTGGAGIGLAVVAQIVDAHGGHVSIEDAPGGGARFVVTLPAMVTEG